MNTVTHTITHVTMTPEPIASHVGKVRMATIVEPWLDRPLALIAGRLWELREVKS